MIAIAGPNLPHDLLIATGRYAGALVFDPERDTPTAELWLESKFAPWARSVLEAWADGEFDDLEYVLFSRADDTSQRLYYYICELQRRALLKGPEPLIFDVGKIPRSASRDRTTEKLRELGRRLAVDDEALEAGIANCNERRSQIQTDPSGKVCLLAGTPPPDRRLHTVIEGTGFAPSGRTLAEDWSDLGPPIANEGGDPFAALGNRLCTTEGGPRSFADPAQLLTSRIDAVGASAAVLWRIEADEAQTWHLPSERRALEQAGIPALVLTRRDWLARDGAIEEIAAFLLKVTK